MDRSERNTRNAQHSTGPRTPAGKAVVAGNAIRHGLRTVAPVVAGLERAPDWQRHLRATCESLRPATHLEGVLAERVALLTWRLARVARYETAAIDRAQHGTDEAIHTAEQLKRLHLPDLAARFASTWPEDIRADAAYTAADARVLAALATAPDAAGVRGEDAALVLNALYDAAAPDEGADVPVPGTPEQGEDEPLEDWCRRVTWTGALLRSALDAFAAHAGTDAGALLATMRKKADLDAHGSAYRAEQMEADYRRRQGERLLPDGDVLDRIGRYEAHLERSVQRTLHELERLQARRAGEPVPVPAALDVTISAEQSQ